MLPGHNGVEIINSWKRMKKVLQVHTGTHKAYSMYSQHIHCETVPDLQCTPVNQRVMYRNLSSSNRILVRMTDDL